MRSRQAETRQRMKITKQKFGIVGFALICAVITGLVCLRPHADDVVVQLVNKRTGRPVTNVTVTLFDSYRTPILSRLKWIPRRLQSYRRCHTVKVWDGIVRVGWVGESSRHTIAVLTIKAEGYEDHIFTYNWEGISRAIPRDPERARNVIAASRIRPVVIPLEPKKG